MLLVDAVDVNESSGRLRGIIFDATHALEDSGAMMAPPMDQNQNDYDQFEGVHLEDALSPGQKRRTSIGGRHAFGLSADHPLSMQSAAMPLGSRLDVQDQLSFMRLFA